EPSVVKGRTSRARLKSSALASRLSQQASAEKIQQRIERLDMTKNALRSGRLRRRLHQYDLTQGKTSWVSISTARRRLYPRRCRLQLFFQAPRGRDNYFRRSLFCSPINRRRG